MWHFRLMCAHSAHLENDTEWVRRWPLLPSSVMHVMHDLVRRRTVTWMPTRVCSAAALAMCCGYKKLM
jgi:hypothetical protein